MLTEQLQLAQEKEIASILTPLLSSPVVEIPEVVAQRR